jgi:hypothetical protein
MNTASNNVMKDPLRVLYRRLKKQPRPVRSEDIVGALISGGLEEEVAQHRVHQIIKTYQMAAELCDKDPMATLVLTVIEDRASFSKIHEHSVSEVAKHLGKRHGLVREAWRTLCSAGFIEWCGGGECWPSDRHHFELTEPVEERFRLKSRETAKRLAAVAYPEEPDFEFTDKEKLERCLKRVVQELPIDNLRKKEALLLEQIGRCKQRFDEREAVLKSVQRQLSELAAEMTAFYAELSEFRRAKRHPLRPDLCDPAPEWRPPWTGQVRLDVEGNVL